MAKTRASRFSWLTIAAMVVAAIAISAGQGPASADVTAVKGGAYGYFGNVSLFGGPHNTRGPAPEVTLPAGGSAVPVTASAPTGSVVYGPAIIFSSGPITLSTQGTIGPGGTVTTTATIDTVNTSQQEVFTADSISSTCTASESGVSGSTLVTNGVLVLQDPNPDVSGEKGEQIVNVPTNPAPNTTYSGTVANVNDNFEYLFNEQIVNPDGSITVYAAHLRLLGPTAIGDVFVGKVECGVTSDGTTTTLGPTTTSDGSTTTTTEGSTTTTTEAPTTTTTEGSTTTTTAPGPVLCNGFEPTIVGTADNDTLNGTSGDDVIVGLAGEDTINGLGGSDSICGGDDDDILVGGDGDDRIFGEAGNDDIDGGAGDYDVLDGGAGNDTIEGGIGFDEIYGGSGDNTLSGGPDDDFIGIFTVDVGEDLVFGGSGNDYLYVEDVFGPGDRFEGGDGNDQLDANLDGGVYLAGAGDDNLRLWRSGTFDPGPGNDRVTFLDAPGETFDGGDGKDAVTVFTAGTFYGGDGNDEVGEQKGGPSTVRQATTTWPFSPAASSSAVRATKLSAIRAHKGSTAAAPATTAPLS